MGFAVLLMTQLTKDTPVPVVWLWMFIAGLGVGPTFSVPTIVIQNAVPFRELGVATSNLTFFRQIGGTVSLAFVGTIFATSFEDNLIPQMTAAGVPQPVTDGFTQASTNGSFDTSSLTGVGDLGAAILTAIPAEFQAAVQPFIGAMVEGIHGAFSLATAQTFWLGVVGAIIAAVAAVAIKEIPLRHHERGTGPDRAPRSPGAGPSGTPEPQSPARHGRSSTDLRSSSHATAPVDPTGAVVRPPQVAFEAMDPRPATFPPDLAALGSADAAFEPVLDLAELPDGAMRRVSRGELDILLANTPAGIVATDDRCPHMSAPLSIGELDGCVVACPLHEGRFDLSTGETVQMPTTGGLDADGNYHPTWSPGGRDAKVDPPGKKAEARRLTRVRRLRYYPVRIVDGRIEVALPRF